MKKLESSGRRRDGKRHWLMRATWSFTTDTVQYGPGRSDAVSSQRSARWSSRISCMSGVWSSAGMNSTKPLREVTRTQFMRDSTHSGGEAVGGPLGAAHPSGSRALGFNEIAADLDSLDTVSATPAESIRFSPDRELPYFPSLIWVAAWGQRCNGVQATYTLYSWLRARRTAHKRRAFLARRYWGRRPLLESRATQRHTKLALCLEPVQGAVASVSPASQCAQSHQKPMRSTRKAQFWTGSAAHVYWRRSSERNRERHQQQRSMSGWRRAPAAGSAPSCNAFYAPVTSVLKLSRRRTRREFGKT